MRRRQAKVNLLPCALFVVVGTACTGRDEAPSADPKPDVTDPPASQGVAGTEPGASASTTPERLRYCAAAEIKIRYATDPERLLDEFGAIDRSPLDSATAERLEQVLRRSRAEFQDSIRPEGGWSWENALLVEAVNDICRTELEARWFDAQA